MSSADELFAEYIAAHEAGGAAPDPRPYLERTSAPERSALAVRIDEHLASTPRRPWDPAAFEASLSSPLMREVATSVDGASGLWPALLPRLRNAARLKRREVVERLATDLGVADREEKVARYYHQMENGLLEEQGVSRTVLEKLARILGLSAEALRDAGRALGPPGAPPGAASSAVFARTATAEDEYPSEAPSAPATPGSEEEEPWDEVDELFLGRRD